jgi:hypothetical protein
MCVVFVLAGALGLSLAAPVARGQDSADQELQGVLPEFVPSGITEADFAELEGNWAQWASETGLLVIDFYSSEDPNVRGRRATLEELQRRVRTMELALADPRYAGIHLKLVDFNSRLAPRVAIMEALLDTIELDLSVHAERHQQAAFSRLATAAQNLTSYLRSIPRGEAWFPYFGLPTMTTAQAAVDAEQFVVLIDDVQRRLAERTALEEAQREFLSREPVLAFEDSLVNAQAALVGQDVDAYRAQIREKAADLLIAIERYEEEPLSEHTRAIRAAYDEIRRLAPDGGARLTQVMRRYYFNYNTQAMVDESLVRSLFNESRFESGVINDMVDQAHVHGCQWTNTYASIDLKPSGQGVRFDLLLNGNIRANVQGDTHMASVYIAGAHGFNGSKEVLFDGDDFQTLPARVFVYANNQPTGADTHFSGVPLFGRISERIALKVAYRQLPDANARTRQQIYQEAKPRFDREVAQNFDEAELELERKFSGPLREQGLFPDARQFTSTEVDLMGRTRLMESGEIGGAAAFPLKVYPAHGVLLQVHESLLNNAAQRFELEGKTFTPDALKEYLTERLERLTSRPVDLDEMFPEESQELAPDEPKVTEVVFADEDAIRFQIERGQVTLYLRMGLIFEDREPIPPQSINIELYPTLVGDKVHIEPGETIGVEAITPVPPGERAAQIARANIMRSKMQDLFQPNDYDAVYEFDLQNKRLTLRLTDLKLRGGWVSAILTDGVTTIQTQTAQRY